VRELLSKYQFPGDDTPIIRGSALKALEGEDSELRHAVDPEAARRVRLVHPEPKREIDKPFLMPVEDVFTITGRGTVTTGRVERGMIKVGEEVEIVGFKPTVKTVVTGVEMFQKLLDEGRGGRQHRRAAARREARGRRARPGALQAGLDHPAQELQGRGLRPQEGRGRPPHAVLQRLPAAVLLPHDRRDRRLHAAGGTEMVMPGDNINVDIELITPIACEEGCASRFARAAAPSAPASSPRSPTTRPRSKPE
jgi:elongation factor Tu